MSLSFPTAIAEHSDYPPLHDKVETNYRRSDDVTLRRPEMTDEMLAAVSTSATATGHKPVARLVDAIIAARAGKFDKAIPRLAAAPEILLAYFRDPANLRDGWVYKRGSDGHLHAWLVTDVVYVAGRMNDDKPSVHITLAANGHSASSRGEGGLTKVTTSVTLHGDDVTRKRVSDVLTNAGLYVETDDLRADYDEALAWFEETLTKGFAEQYRYTGTPLAVSWDRAGRRDHRKVIHDIARSEVPPATDFIESAVFDSPAADTTLRKRKIVTDDGDPDRGVGRAPQQFGIRVFDLTAHDFIWVSTRDLVRYEYDATLRDKIILPADQRNLLDILTADLDAFTGDVIEGKSAGNVVLCKGAPGKTLTAEVYSELIARPLYSIHSGNLGITADAVRKNLEVTFTRAKRWNTVLLLDEADVFVLERGDNLMQNAIVAEFLRTLEYFDGLMFMTTNRANNIDDAILSRAAAIIDYQMPDLDGIRAVWQVQATQQGATIDADLLDDLVHGFVTISPRDVKMLLRLALRVAKGQGVPLDADTIARCAMFRGLHFSKGSRS